MFDRRVWLEPCCRLSRVGGHAIGDWQG
jgi:hypothetical protein